MANKTIDTHCEATTYSGTTWSTAKQTCAFSGTPSGVILMLFERMVSDNPKAAESLLENLKQTLEESKS